MFIVTPYLWVTSLDNFINLFFYDLNVTGSIKVTNQFLGKLYASTDSPWYYYITWILFTNPILFLLLSLGGAIIISYKFFIKFLRMNFNQKFWISKDEMFDYFIFFNLIFFLFIISRFSMSNFDGWRHVYFVYPLIVINSIYFLNKVNQNNLLYFKILLIIL